MWPGEETQDVAASGPISDLTSSLFENFTSEAAAPPSRKSTAEGTSSPREGYKVPARVPGVLRSGPPIAYDNGDATLPPEKPFSILIGWRLFRLSGASLMSDAPSYFSTYFEEQMRQEEEGNGSTKTLYVDRDPDTFADICRHLQGYYIAPRDATHFVKLYADAQFYSLPRLISQLFEADIFVAVGGQPFRIPRDTFSGPGNSSNFFTLGFAGFTGTREDAFPGLESRGLMRPPPILPQSVSNRCPEILRDLINLSRGYLVNIRDANHRSALLGDCKYYGFKGLMHKLFKCEITYNVERGSAEIVMRLEDLHKSGVSFFSDPTPSDSSPLGGWVHYARPFVDETSYEVIVEIASQETKIDFRSSRAEFYGETKARVSSLFQTVADKMNLPNNLPLGLMMSSGGASAAPASPANTPLSDDRVKIHIGTDAHILLDGSEHYMDPYSYATSSGQSEHEDWSSVTPQSPIPRLSPRQVPGQPAPGKKRKRRGSMDEFGEWVVKKAQWRLRVQPKQEVQMHSRRGQDGGMEIVLHAVKMEAFSGQRGRNMRRGWVS